MIDGPTGGGSEPAARVAGLHYLYPDGRPALRGVDFAIRAGESVALVGPNGAGKSTLLLHLNGVLPGHARESRAVHGDGVGAKPHRHDGPAIWIDGLPVIPKNLREIRRRVGLLFQDPDDQLFATSVLEDVAFGPLNLGMPRAEARRVALDCLARVDLAAMADRPPHHLSFGERKRACLAGVLACSPILLALDEPTANLDPRARRRFLALIASLPAAKLIATHDLEMALDLCPRALILDAGRVVADGPTRTLLGDPDLMDAHGLEVPLSLQGRRPD
ncbi:energy-coupling factor ABC transporter ATP-binding protein [Tundrisphaera sp. TA3]|uniref:energy-coupling factor ABC transporter ATP-binding protein n=1 Tax=Tundrisphaera sp. TA3 TaxID=3435775 RepID=UPI003EB97B5E